ncbi:hypothetical protein EYF80_020851 [Liparis tanakae]|uniref:Uncharacterized protein n=1 Tax=Liparis tanakae TaxID=230148 RepID=A0A4Z2HTK9_9TELE|nr:hypothetical protein EYF80_020851 [Liparis tanakae]
MLSNFSAGTVLPCFVRLSFERASISRRVSASSSRSAVTAPSARLSVSASGLLAVLEAVADAAHFGRGALVLGLDVQELSAQLFRRLAPQVLLHGDHVGLQLFDLTLGVQHPLLDVAQRVLQFLDLLVSLFLDGVSAEDQLLALAVLAVQGRLEPRRLVIRHRLSPLDRLQFTPEGLQIAGGVPARSGVTFDQGNELQVLAEASVVKGIVAQAVHRLHVGAALQQHLHRVLAAVLAAQNQRRPDGGKNKKHYL